MKVLNSFSPVTLNSSQWSVLSYLSVLDTLLHEVTRSIKWSNKGLYIPWKIWTLLAATLGYYLPSTPQACWCLLNSPSSKSPQYLNANEWRNAWGSFPWVSQGLNRRLNRTELLLLLHCRASDTTLSWGGNRTDFRSSVPVTDGMSWTWAQSKQQRETESKTLPGSDMQMQRTHWPLHRSKANDSIVVCWCSLLDRNDKYSERERGSRVHLV